MNDLDNIRLKEISELNEEDKKVLNEGWDKLTEEERDYFGTVHSTSKESEGGSEFIPKFKTQEEFDNYVAEKVTATIEERNKKRAEERRSKGDNSDRFFPEGYKAKDWDEPFKTAVPKIVDMVTKKIEGTQAEKRAALEKINKGFEEELDAIAAKDKNVPAKGTKEREEWESEVAKIGQKYHLHTMTDSYNVWQLERKANPQAVETVNIPKEGSTVVDKVSRGYGAGTQGKKTVYKVGGGRRLDEMIEQRMREEGIPT